MTSPGWWRTWNSSRLVGLPTVDVAVAALLSAFAIGLTSGALHPSYHAPDLGAAASAGVLAMTAPVAWRRRWPLAAAGTLAVGAGANALVFGPMVRCGAALPAVFLVAFSVGEHLGRNRSLLGLALCAANVAAQCFYDPRLGASALSLMLPVLAGFFIVSRLVRTRNQAAEALRLQSAELRRQREATALLAVKADRARVAGDLDATLREWLDQIADAASAGREVTGADLALARQALRDIEHSGRQILHEMREKVGTYQQDAPNEPQPTLARFSDFLGKATTADARLTVEGNARRLPAGLELSAARIAEHLVLALEDAPTAIIDVRLRFGSDAIELHVEGVPARNANPEAALTAARQRAFLHGGTVEGRSSGGRYYAAARLPLVSSHA
jgi:hypothetical protein